MTTGCCETSLLLFANTRGAGTLLTVKCPGSGTHRETNARGFPGGGMLTVGIDSHISHAISVLTAKFQSSLKLTKYRQLYNGLELLCIF